MKICVLSMQRIQNFGSLLQAYSLKSILEKLGHDVEFIDIKKINNDYKILGDRRQVYSSEISNWNEKKIKKMQLRISNKIQNLLFEYFRIKKLNIKRKREKYDICIIGSDEVFNCLGSGWWGFTSQLFGNVVEAPKVITYAASCGSTTYEKLPEAVKNRIEESFLNISAFSVRDENTFSFVSHLSRQSPVFNLDPVLIYNFDNHLKKRDIRLPKKYCIIYAYDNRINDIKEIQSIIDFCKKNHMVPVSIGGHQRWCKKHYICTPFQCLNAFAGSSFVITDTFHGTIFSAKYAEKFGVLIRKSNKNKLTDLVDRINVSNHVLKNIEELDKVFQIVDDKSNIKNILSIERNKTLNYLSSNIYK